MPCAQYGLTAPFTQAIIEALGNKNLPPNDWKQVARACLSGGDYLIWRSEFAEQCGITADINQRQGLNTTYEMMVGSKVRHGYLWNLTMRYARACVPHPYALLVGSVNIQPGL